VKIFEDPKYLKTVSAISEFKSFGNLEDGKQKLGSL
jgi:hypothetical protein